MYEHFYGLTFNPFDKSSPIKAAFQSKDHFEMLNRLSFLKNTRGIGLFTAPPGMGYVKDYGYVKLLSKT